MGTLSPNPSQRDAIPLESRREIYIDNYYESEVSFASFPGGKEVGV